MAIFSLERTCSSCPGDCRNHVRTTTYSVAASVSYCRYSMAKIMRKEFVITTSTRFSALEWLPLVNKFLTTKSYKKKILSGHSDISFYWIGECVLLVLKLIISFYIYSSTDAVLIILCKRWWNIKKKACSWPCNEPIRRSLIVRLLLLLLLVLLSLLNGQQ